MLVDPNRPSPKGGDRIELSDEFYERLNSLIEAAQSLTRSSEAPSRDEALGNLEAIRSGISHAALVRRVIAMRRLREDMLPASLFADPAWDMLLDLYGAHIAQHRVPVSSLCIAASVPATTALRWIGNLEEAGLIARQKDPHDARRVFISLTPTAIGAMQDYFDQVSDSIAIAA